MKKLAVFMTAVMVVFSAHLYSQPAEGRGFKDFINDLNLTEQQKKDFDKIHADMQKKLIVQRANIQTAQIELEQLLKSDKPEKSSIETKVNEMSKLDAQLRMIRIDSWFEINKQLTPEQQKIWKKALAAGPAMGHRMMEGHMMEGHGKGKGPMNVPEPPPQPAPQPSTP